MLNATLRQIPHPIRVGIFFKKFGKDIESMTDIAIEAFMHTIQSKEVYIIILAGISIYFIDKIMKS